MHSHSVGVLAVTGFGRSYEDIFDRLFDEYPDLESKIMNVAELRGLQRRLAQLQSVVSAARDVVKSFDSPWLFWRRVHDMNRLKARLDMLDIAEIEEIGDGSEEI